MKKLKAEREEQKKKKEAEMLSKPNIEEEDLRGEFSLNNAFQRDEDGQLVVQMD
jgi:hypothetical protein